MEQTQYNLLLRWFIGRAIRVLYAKTAVTTAKVATSRATSAATTTTLGYSISQQKRKLIGQGFGWAKTVGNIRQVMVRGIERVDQVFVLTMAAYHLTRMRTLGQIRPEMV